MNLRLIEEVILISTNTLSTFLIIIVISNSFNERLYRWFVIMTILLIGWVDFAYLGYLERNVELAKIFYKLNGAFVSFFLLSVYMFYIDAFLEIRKRKLKAILIISSIIFGFIELFTKEIDKGIIQKEWGNDVIFGPINNLFIIYTLIISAIFIYFSFKKYLQLSNNYKKKVRFFITGLSLLVIFNVIFNVLTPAILKTAKYQHLGDYSAIFFFIFTTLAIIKERFLNIKIILPAFAISIVSILLLIDIIIMSDNLSEQSIKFLIFVFFILISINLLRSILTELKQKEELSLLNQNLNKSRQKYIDLASEQKDIIDVMGHEIRTPLTAIVQELNLQKKIAIPKESDILKGNISDSEASEILKLVFESLDTIDKASIQAVSLVNNMIETARLDKDNFELHYEQFDLVELIETCVEVISKTIDIDKFKIIFNTTNVASIIVNADKTRISESIYAVLTNSYVYRDLTKKSNNVEISIEEKKGNVFIYFKDNGIGIVKEDINKLGKKFIRLNPNTKNLQRPGGSGLGLFVVKNIMKHHNGKLLIESEGISNGSTFTLVIPLKH